MADQDAIAYWEDRGQEAWEAKMADDPIERAARAIYQEQPGCDNWDGLETQYRLRPVMQARAAIATLRDPPAEVVVAFMAASDLLKLDLVEEEAIRIWQAGFDALLGAGDG